jgi:hypothetical protein
MVAWDEIGLVIYTCPRRAGMAEAIQDKLPKPAAISMDIDRPLGLVVGRDNFINALAMLEASSGNQWGVVLEDDIVIGPDFERLPEWLDACSATDGMLFLYASDRQYIAGKKVIPYSSPMSCLGVAFRQCILRSVIDFLKLWFSVERPYGSGYALGNFLKRSRWTAKRTMPSLIDHLDIASAIRSNKKRELRSKSFDVAYRGAGQ